MEDSENRYFIKLSVFNAYFVHSHFLKSYLQLAIKFLELQPIFFLNLLKIRQINVFLKTAESVWRLPGIAGHGVVPSSFSSNEEKISKMLIISNMVYKNGQSR